MENKQSVDQFIELIGAIVTIHRYLSGNNNGRTSTKGQLQDFAAALQIVIDKLPD